MSQVYTSGLLGGNPRFYVRNPTVIPFGPSPNESASSLPEPENRVLIGSLTVPPGKYLILVTTAFINYARFIAQDNSREVVCDLFGTWYFVALDGHSDGAFAEDLAIQRVEEFTGTTTIEVWCWALSLGATGDSQVRAHTTVITAIKVDEVN